MRIHDVISANAIVTSQDFQNLNSRKYLMRVGYQKVQQIKFSAG